MNSSITESITAGQRKQISRLVEDIMASVNTGVEHTVSAHVDSLDFGGAQHLIEHGNELKAFASGIKDSFVSKLRELSTTNQYGNEEVESRYGYLSGYTGPKPIREQVARIAKLFGLDAKPTLAWLDAHPNLPVPEGAEGFFAIPRFQAVDSTYSGALRKVLDLLKKAYKGRFHNWRDGEIDERHIRQSARTAAWLDKIAGEQKDCDILIVPAQFGKRHAGRSIRRAREVFLGSEFGLGAFATGSMLLTHEDRLRHYDDLWIDCSGDEWSPGGGGAFSVSVYWDFSDGGLGFGKANVGDARDRYGSASGFAPQF